MIKLPKRQHLSRQKQQRSIHKRQSTVNSDADSDSDTASDGSIDWQVTQLNWQRCESIWLTWAGGHGPFNVNATWWPDGQSSDANSGMVAYLVGNHNYQWVARTPPNTTFKFDVVDTSDGQRISSPLEIHVGSGYAQGISSCPLDTPASSSFAYQYAVTSSSSPAAVQATATSSLASTSAYVYPSSNSTTEDPSLQSANADSSSSSSTSQKDVKGLKAGIALLCLALIALAFMYYRLRKQMQRLQKGQSTVGRWMNHHADAEGRGGRLGAIMGGRQRQDPYQRMEDTDQDSASNMKSKDIERSSFAMSETSDLSSRMSSFFDHRSASRSGSRASATRPTIRNPFIDTASVSSPSVVGKAQDEEDEEGEEDEAFRSASQQRRHSETSSDLSDVTVTSGVGSRLSSVTHSDLASNVGNASVVSDDHYHRAKASTISPTALGPARTAMAQYLDPQFALLDSRR